jgi:hypothetical protein
LDRHATAEEVKKDVSFEEDESEEEKVEKFEK